jgi:hypothetical protein
MPPLAVVEQLDVVEDCAACLLAHAPLTSVDQFNFERGEKALRHRIVPAVTLRLMLLRIPCCASNC